MLLEISSLSCGFTEKSLFSNVNLVINPGDKVAIMGPNGIGKTSFLRTIIGLNDPLSGQIKFEGSSDVRRRELGKLITYVPQTIEAFPDLLAFQFFEDLLPEKEIIQNLALSDLLNRPYRSLSGGEKQRILLASALARPARIILADELTQGVDNEFSEKFAESINNYLKQHSAALLLVTHDREWAEKHCNIRYYLTKDGLIK